MPVDFAPHAAEKTTHAISMCRAMHEEDDGVDEEGVGVLTEGAIEGKSGKIECFKRERTGRCGARGPNGLLVLFAFNVCLTLLCACVYGLAVHLVWLFGLRAPEPPWSCAFRPSHAANKPQ